MRTYLVVAVSVLALGLSGCTVTLAKDSVVWTDAHLKEENVVLMDKPAKTASLPTGYRLAFEDLKGDAGLVHTVIAESSPDKPLIVFCGGNRFREEAQGAPTLEALTQFGDVLMFDYPGYGASEGHGTRSEFKATEKVIAARAEALVAARASKQVIFLGHSLGGGVCASLAGSSPLDSRLVLAGTFARYDDIKDDMLGIVSSAVTLKVNDDAVAYDAPLALKAYRGAITVVALSEDETIPFAVSEKLAERLRAEGKTVQFIRLEGKGHGAMMWRPEFIAAVKDALAK